MNSDELLVTLERERRRAEYWKACYLSLYHEECEVEPYAGPAPEDCLIAFREIAGENEDP